MDSTRQTTQSNPRSTDPPRLPFGKYSGAEIGDVPADYLGWLIRESKISAGLDTEVRAELARRGVNVPPAPPPLPRKCREHPAAGIACYWMRMRDGRKMIRGECRQCGRTVGSLPQIEPFISQANDGSDPTALLKVLVMAEELGVVVTRHGDGLSLDPYAKTTPELRALARQARYALAPMLMPGGVG